MAIQAFFSDLGVELQLEVESDSSSARSFASRRGLGKQRHVQTRYLWIQDQVANGALVILKVAGGKNVADILTKATTSAVLKKHLAELGMVFGPRSTHHKGL